MISFVPPFLFVLIFFLALYIYTEYLVDVVSEVMQGRKSRKDRQNERFIQKVDRYYHEV